MLNTDISYPLNMCFRKERTPAPSAPPHRRQGAPARVAASARGALNLKHPPDRRSRKKRPSSVLVASSAPSSDPFAPSSVLA